MLYAIGGWYWSCSSRSRQRRLAAFIPVLTGDAFNDMLKVPPATKVLLPLALLMGGSQILRGCYSWDAIWG